MILVPYGPVLGISIGNAKTIRLDFSGQLGVLGLQLCDLASRRG
jgi:hypothetical protein